MTIATALEIYCSERAPEVKDPRRIGYSVAALVPILGSLPVGNITGAVCRRYDKVRGKGARHDSQGTRRAPSCAELLPHRGLPDECAKSAASR